MLVRVFAVSVVLMFTGLGGSASATVDTLPVDTTPVPTVNEFLPEDVAIGDCISAVPKPGCGSEAHGGWHQYFVLIALVAGLGVIGWRIVAGVRRQPTPT